MTITILDITHPPVFYLKHGVSETEFCLRLQVAQLSMFHLRTERESSLRNVVKRQYDG
jgi:hypothetical protein